MHRCMASLYMLVSLLQPDLTIRTVVLSQGYSSWKFVRDNGGAAEARLVRQILAQNRSTVRASCFLDRAIGTSGDPRVCCSMYQLLFANSDTEDSEIGLRKSSSVYNNAGRVPIYQSIKKPSVKIHRFKILATQWQIILADNDRYLCRY